MANEILYPTFKRGVDSALPSTIGEGLFLLATDTSRLLIDIDGSRVEITDFIKRTEAQILSTIAPLPKFYYATDTMKFYYYNNGWKVVGDNVATATKLATARKISITGDATGSVNFDGSEDVSVEVAVGNDTHSHTASTLPAASTTVKGVMLLGASGGAATYGHSHSNMGAASADAAGSAGFVPAPGAGSNTKFLRGDGTWATPTDTVYTHPTSAGNKHIPSGGASGNILVWSAAGTAQWAAPSTITAGAVAWANVTGKPTTLSGYGITDAAPKVHGHDAMTGASSSAAGTVGFVPAPAAGDQAKFLRGDGKWVVPTDTVYTHPTTAGNKHIPTGGASGNILVWSADGTATWAAPSTINAGAASSVAWANVTGKPSTFTPSDHDHTISEISDLTNMGAATASAAGKAGLVPAPAAGAQAKFLRGDGTWQTPYTHPTSGITAGTYRSVTVNSQGHVTAGSNPTTLSGYGITDAAPKTHGHDASEITSGTISIDRLPKGALERLVVVANDTARFALTTDKAQTGDTVKVTDTGKMYYIVDDTKLSSESGYEVYTAGAASSVAWSGVTGKPSTFTPSAHDHEISEISDLETVLAGKAANINMGAATASAAGKAGLVPAPAAGAQAKFLRGDGTWQTPTDTVYTHPTTAGNKHIPTGGASGNILVWSASGTATWAAPSTITAGAASSVAWANVTGKPTTLSGYGITDAAPKNHEHVAADLPTASSTAKGIMLLGASGGAATYEHTHSNMGAASASAAGKAGMVPAPAAGDNTKFLRGDGKWVVPTDTVYTHPTSAGNKHIPSGGASGNILVWSAAGTAQWAAPSTITAGAVAWSGVTGKPTTLSGYGITDAATANHSHDAMTGASSSAAGTKGFVPAPAAGAQAKFLRGDGTWQTPYTHPTSTGNKHIPSGGASGNILVWSADGTATWAAPSTITAGAVAWANVTGKPTSFTPATHSHAISDITNLETTLAGKAANTNMGAATSSAAGTAGLVPAPAAGAQAKFLRGDGTWQTPYTHPTSAGNKHVPSGGASGNILGWSAAGTAAWVAPSTIVAGSASGVADNGDFDFGDEDAS